MALSHWRSGKGSIEPSPKPTSAIQGSPSSYEVVADGGVAAHFAHRRPGHSHDPESDLFQRPAEEAVHFVAPAAAAPAHDLVVGVGRIGRHPALELDVEVLVGDGQQVGPMQRAQGCQVRRGRTRVADAVEIGLKVHARHRWVT